MESNEIKNRYLTYNKEHCWQYDIRLSNIEKDLKDSNLTLDETKNLKISDFVFKQVENKNERDEIKNFIYRHEWLGSLSQYTTHWFACYYKDILAGVVLMHTLRVCPYNGKIISDRFFRQKTVYKKYVEELGLTWQKDWQTKTGMNWSNIPDDIEKKLREYSKMKQEQSKMIEFPKKHKYAYVLGSNPTETKILRKNFLDKSKIYEYPKKRGE